MNECPKDLWRGLATEATANLVTRDYRSGGFAEQVSEAGIEAGKLAAADRSNSDVLGAWIPGVEIFTRSIYPQRHRGSFGEFVRRDEGVLKRIGFWPQQWASALRRYNEEQWDVMFFVQGVVEMILREARAGMPARTMRFSIDGDNHRSANNVGLVVPPGVAHALRVEGSEDLIMVYGTSTIFRPEFEGRIASDIETAPLPESWQKFLVL